LPEPTHITDGIPSAGWRCSLVPGTPRTPSDTWDTESAIMRTMRAPSPGFSRRLLLAAGTAGAAGVLAGPSGAAATSPARPVDESAVEPHGDHQAGITRPDTAQDHCTVAVCDLNPATVFSVLAALGTRIAALTRGGDAALGGLPPATLTITVGLGPRVVTAVDPALPGATDLPVFAHEDISPSDRGGDLLLQVCAMDPLVVSLAVTALLTALNTTARWQAHGSRGAPLDETGACRNLLGFGDGIAGPRTDTELSENVWLGGRLAGGTLAVVRRITLDTAGFLRQPLARQEAVIGRRRDNAEPLSGGGPRAGIDLGAKTPEGEYLIPADAHVRIAHPLTNGTGLMLRRGYNTADGLLFISFQRELRTFTATQSTMDERDALMRFSTVTATGTFLILPGFTPDEPLGTSLRRAR